MLVNDYKFPRAKELNPILYDIVLENLSGGVKAGVYGDGGGGIITDYKLHKENIKEVDELISWVKRILPDASKNFATKGKPRLGLHSHEDEKGYDYDVNSFEIESCWGIHYNGKESILEHNHFPALLAFVYYVKTPKGSAPFMLESEPYNVEEGDCNFFLASQFHSVNPSQGAGRCAIVGNIIYTGYTGFGG
jgi:hypothetical protein|tara:strand:- start:432 stop:1007 length:576 start_codon:yes stop_codon:yes gene_type:complete